MGPSGTNGGGDEGAGGYFPGGRGDEGAGRGATGGEGELGSDDGELADIGPVAGIAGVEVLVVADAVALVEAQGFEGRALGVVEEGNVAA